MPVVPEATLNHRSAQPVENMFGEVGKVADVLKGLFPDLYDAELDTYNEEARRVAAAYARLFSTSDGRTVLEHLCDITVREATFLVSPQLDPMVGYAMGAREEGKKAAVWAIITMIALGREQKPPQRKGT